MPSTLVGSRSKSMPVVLHFQGTELAPSSQVHQQSRCPPFPSWDNSVVQNMQGSTYKAFSAEQRGTLTSRDLSIPHIFVLMPSKGRPEMSCAAHRRGPLTGEDPLHSTACQFEQLSGFSRGMCTSPCWLCQQEHNP